MSRPFLVIVLLISLILASCNGGAATSSAELGSAQDPLPTPTPTAAPILPNIDVQPGVVIAPTPTPEGPLPLEVVTLMGETGVMAPIDGPALAGVVAEIDRLNSEGGLLGRPIRHRRIDTNSRTSVAARMAERLFEDPPDLLVVTCDTEFSRPILTAADLAGVITISPCADDPEYLTGALGSRNFTLGAPAGPRGALAAQAAFDRYGDTAIVLRDVTSPEALSFCDGFERAFREIGGTVTYRDEFSYDTLEPVQDRLAERGREAAFITVCSHVPGGVDAAPSIILILRTLGFNSPIVAGSSVDEPGWFGLVPTLGELTFVSWSSSFGNDPDERINQVVRRVQQNGDTPGAGVSTILGAEAIEAWARAVETARDASPDQVVTALGAFSDEQFATGEISFTGGARMDTGRLFRILEVVDGELSVVGIEATSD